MSDWDGLAARLNACNLTEELAARLLPHFSSAGIRDAERRALEFAGFPSDWHPVSLVHWLESGMLNAEMARGMFKGFVEDPERDIYLTPSVIIGIALAAQVYVYVHHSSRILVPDNRVADLRHISRSPEVVYTVDPHYFEELVAFLYELLGMRVQVTKRSHDWGADVLVWHPSAFSGDLFRAVQVKRYAPHRKVGLTEVQRMKGVLLDFRASSGEIVTSSWFTGPAKISAAKDPVQVSLTDYARLMQRMEAVLSGGAPLSER
jgi:hypothetical protein